jgi:hypothetical protein
MVVVLLGVFFPSPPFDSVVNRKTFGSEFVELVIEKERQLRKKNQTYLK